MNGLSNRRFLIVGLIAATLLLPAFAVVDAAEQQPGLPVETARATADTLVNKVEAVGTLRANETVTIRPEIDGRITRFNFSEGGQVEQGQLLVALDDSIYAAELKQAEARLALGRSNFNRATTLKKQGFGSDQEQDQTASELQVNQAEVALAKARLEKTRIMAPFDGVVGLRKVSQGDYLTTGQDIVTLFDLSQLRVDFRLPEATLAEVAVGQRIEVRLDAFADKTFSGEVYAVDPQIDLNGRSLRISARIPNDNGELLAGQFARVTLILSRKEQALFVPEAALVPEGRQQFVYQVVDGKVVWKQVKVGKRVGTRVEILDGLKAGDQVVTAGHLKLHDGMGVTPMPAKGS